MIDSDKQGVDLFIEVLSNSTPKEWLQEVDKGGKKFSYIKRSVVKELYNTFFGIGNHWLEIKEIERNIGKTSSGKTRVDVSIHGYMKATWANEDLERKGVCIEAAGSGSVIPGTFSFGDDLKGAMTDMRRKALANMGLFSDIYDEDEKAEEEIVKEQAPTSSIPRSKVEESVVMLEQEALLGKLTEERIDDAIKFMKDNGQHPDLLERIVKLKKLV